MYPVIVKNVDVANDWCDTPACTVEMSAYRVWEVCHLDILFNGDQWKCCNVDDCGKAWHQEVQKQDSVERVYYLNSMKHCVNANDEK